MDSAFDRSAKYKETRPFDVGVEGEERHVGALNYDRKHRGCTSPQRQQRRRQRLINPQRTKPSRTRQKV